MKKLFVLILLLFFIFSTKEDVLNKISEISNDSVEEVSNKYPGKFLLEEFESIRIGDSKNDIIDKLGLPERIDESEYGFKWYVYKNNKEKFLMVGIENDRVCGLFTNKINSIEGEGIEINKDMNFIRKNFIPLKYKTKGNIKFMIESNNEYDIIFKNKKYITAFYDKHNDNKIWSLLIISENSENKNKDIYGKKDKKLGNSFALEILDLTNCMRYDNNLNNLKISDKATTSAKKHSLDMKENNYFDHNNLKRESPFDRMENENIIYKTAGENIAAGQVNAIYAHNGWLNSMGHRKNILGNYTYIGIGVIFGGHYKTYYTQNFFG